jgi:hypothetical protein
MSQKIFQNETMASQRRVYFTAVADGSGDLDQDTPLTDATVGLFSVSLSKAGAASYQPFIGTTPIRGTTSPVATATSYTTATTSPASTEVGDLIIFFVWLTGTSMPTHTPNQADAVVFSTALSDGADNGRLTVGYRVATSAGAVAYTPFTSGGGSGAVASVTACVVLKAGFYDLTGITGSGSANTGTTAPNPPSVTLNQRKIVFAIGGWQLASSLDNTATPPSGYTSAVSLSGSNQTDFAAAYRLFGEPVATAEDPGTFTDTQTPNGTVGGSLAIKIVNPPNVVEVDAADQPGLFYLQLDESDSDTVPALIATVTSTNPGGNNVMKRRNIHVRIEASAGGVAPTAEEIADEIETRTLDVNVVSMETDTVDANALATDAVTEIANAIDSPTVEEIADEIETRTLDVNVVTIDPGAVSDIQGDILDELIDIGGLLHRNATVDNVVRSGGSLVSARLRIFANAAALAAAVVGAADDANGEIRRYAITGTVDGNGRMSSFKATQVL